MAVLCVPAIGQSQSKSAAQAQTPAVNERNAAAAQSGQKLYERVGCYECHGHEGQGGAAGKRLAPHPIVYSDFSNYCRHPTAEMPPYSAKILSDAELASIYAYLQSLPDPPAAKTIPLLNPASKKAGP